MTLYVIVLTVKCAKEYWVSEMYKITNKFNTSHCMRLISSQLVEKVLNHAPMMPIHQQLSSL